MQYFLISKMSKFTHNATGLRKFLTEATGLRFPRKFMTINYNTKILDPVSLLYSSTIHTNFKLTVSRTRWS